MADMQSPHDRDEGRRFELFAEELVNLEARLNRRMDVLARFCTAGCLATGSSLASAGGTASSLACGSSISSGC